MIWTVVLWLGMQGQAGHMSAEGVTWMPQMFMGHVVDDYSECVNEYVWASPADPFDHNKIHYLCTAPLAEHIFEIRAKREEGAPIKSEYLIGCREGFTLTQSEHVSGDVWTTEGCVRITRELYMDGQRLGIIKGLE